MLVGPWVTGLQAAPVQGCGRGAALGLTLGAPHIFSSTSRVRPSQDQECGLSLEGCLPASSERCFLLLIKPLVQPDRGSEIQSVRCSQTAGQAGGFHRPHAPGRMGLASAAAVGLSRPLREACAMWAGHRDTQAAESGEHKGRAVERPELRSSRTPRGCTKEEVRQVSLHVRLWQIRANAGQSAVRRGPSLSLRHHARALFLGVSQGSRGSLGLLPAVVGPAPEGLLGASRQALELSRGLPRFTGFCTQTQRHQAHVPLCLQPLPPPWVSVSAPAGDTARATVSGDFIQQGAPFPWGASCGTTRPSGPRAASSFLSQGAPRTHRMPGPAGMVPGPPAPPPRAHGVRTALLIHTGLKGGPSRPSPSSSWAV